MSAMRRGDTRAGAHRPARARGTRRLGRPPGTDGDQTRQRILAAARACFSELGFEGATNAAVAEAAGITHGSIYHYFGSKADLFIAVEEEVSARVDERYASAVAGVATLRGKLAALVDSFVDLVRRDPSVASFLVVWALEVPRHPELRPRRRRILRETLDFYRRLVDEAKADGEIPAGVDPAALAHAMRSILFGLSALSASHRDAALLRSASDVLLRMLAGNLFPA